MYIYLPLLITRTILTNMTDTLNIYINRESNPSVYDVITNSRSTITFISVPRKYFSQIFEKCFLGTACIVIGLACSDPQPHNSVLTAFNRLYFPQLKHNLITVMFSRAVCTSLSICMQVAYF